jgi:hypothetical protein
VRGVDEARCLTIDVQQIDVSDSEFPVVLPPNDEGPGNRIAGALLV